MNSQGASKNSSPEIYVNVMNKIIKVKKNEKSFLHKLIYRFFLPFTLGGMLIIVIVFLVLAYGFKWDDDVLDYYAGIIVPSFIALILLLLAFLPLCRVKQAKISLQNYDFSYCPVEDCKLSYSNRVLSEKLFCSASPFDTDEIVTLKGEEVDAYLEQFCNENVYSVEIFNRDEFQPFEVIDYVYEIKKTTDGKGGIEVTLSAVHTVEFHEDGITANGLFYPYEKVKALFYAYFSVDKGVNAAINFYLSEEEDIIASFALSGKILAVADRFGIEIEDRATADYVMRNPEKAFKKLAFWNRI